MHFPPVRDIVRRYSLWLPLAAVALRACSLSAPRHAMTCPAYSPCPKVSCKGALIALPGRGCLS